MSKRKDTRPMKAGRLRASSIVEDAHLFYNDSHAAQYLQAVADVLLVELRRRLVKKQKELRRRIGL